VHQAISQMDSVTQQNAALVEEAAAATGSLKSQVNQLAAAVSVFRIEGAVPVRMAAQQAVKPPAPPARPAMAAARSAAKPLAASSTAPARAQAAAKLPAAPAKPAAPATAAAAADDGDWTAF
jgi:methyl-accepting chemotaxis protein